MNYHDIFTDRFVLKILTSELVGQDYLSWFDDPTIVEFIAYAKKKITLSELQAFAEEKLASPETLFFGIFLKKSYQHIGNIKFEPINFSKKYCALGILIGHPDWRGKGVFSEISSYLEKILLKEGLDRIYLGVEKANAPALNAYLKAGYIIDQDNLLNVDSDKGYCMVKRLT